MKFFLAIATDGRVLIVKALAIQAVSQILWRVDRSFEPALVVPAKWPLLPQYIQKGTLVVQAPPVIKVVRMTPYWRGHLRLLRHVCETYAEELKKDPEDKAVMVGFVHWDARLRKEIGDEYAIPKPKLG